MTIKEKNKILNEKNEILRRIREGIDICILKIYAAKTEEDADRKIKFLKGIYKQVNEFR